MSAIPTVLKNSLTNALKAQNKLLKSNSRLDNAVTNCEKQGIPSIAISPSQGQQLQILCQLIKAKNILEIGTLGGYSTIWFAESSPDCHVTSIEYDSKHRDVALENLSGLKNIDIHLGAALEVLPKVAEEGKVFDFVFIDADWENQHNYFDWAVKLTRKGGCIYVDNVVRWLNESEAEGDENVWALIDTVTKDERVSATLIPTASTHKHMTEVDALVDGYVLAYVK